jgi:hypothetical protein
MRAHSYKRFAIVICVAAVGVMALGAQTATPSTGEPVDSTPPDLQLSGKMKQEFRHPVKVKARCGDEACTVDSHVVVRGKRDEGEPITTLFHEKDFKRRSLVRGETTTLKVKLSEKPSTLTGSRSPSTAVRRALNNGRQVEARFEVNATDAADNLADATRTVKLVK